VPGPLPAPLGGSNLISRLAEVLTNERLSRDLLQADKTNARLQAVEDVMNKLNVSVEAAKAIKAALGWRHLGQTLICPATSLPGTSFAGFSDPKLRAGYGWLYCCGGRGRRKSLAGGKSLRKKPTRAATLV
jgi:hypothetical protein